MQKEMIIIIQCITQIHIIISKSLNSMICPKCNKDEFSNMQGFVNHCRMTHNIDFPTHRIIQP